MGYSHQSTMQSIVCLRPGKYFQRTFLKKLDRVLPARLSTTNFITPHRFQESFVTPYRSVTISCQ